MASFGQRTRGYPRSRGRTGPRWGSPRSSAAESGGGLDRDTLGIVGTICAVAGFFALGIVLGPAALVCGWLSMGRVWNPKSSIPALVAVVLGAIDTVLALLWLGGVSL
ncbi:small hydrophobic protein [Streptomyces sp. NPDC048278]|uniref:small hydrophobic protein n=1 Tax=unclassified Streptomyces TaxID=2593676 RepID=UPI0034493B35